MLVMAIQMSAKAVHTLVKHIQTLAETICKKGANMNNRTMEFAWRQNKDYVGGVLVLSQCKTTSAYEEPRSSGNYCTNYLFDPRSIH